MDNGLVLNLTVDDQLPAKSVTAQKGGRWTDRVKARKAAKRKARFEDGPSAEVARTEEEVQPRPAKRPRKESSEQTMSTHDRPTHNTRPSQIISSLFSYNPKVEIPHQNSTPKAASQPSNAPLADASTFSGLGLDPLICAHLTKKMSISKPTSIQSATLSSMLFASSEASSRDVFIQSQTGSGKTLSFLLPIVQDLLPLGTQSYIDRCIGTLAIIIAPTRELAKQIADTLEALLKLRLRPDDESAEDPSSSTRLTRWLVSGLLTGGATRSHEKARLRKGIPILVSTPGRLLDHLQKTSSFNVGKCRWLVLDEADRLMELGFQDTIAGIIQALDGRRNLAIQAWKSGSISDVGGWDWERRRRTVLCSATLSESVQTLAGSVLVKPLMIRPAQAGNPEPLGTAGQDHLVLLTTTEKFTPPSQLSQKFVVVPLKLRLVALIALLRTLIAQPNGRGGNRIIVFLSCTDSVDFHWHLLGSSSIDKDGTAPDDTDDEDQTVKETDYNGGTLCVKSPLLPNTSIYRLHGSLPTPVRRASLHGFSATSAHQQTETSRSKARSTEVKHTGEKKSPPPQSILLCTSVASRGLDLPLVRAVVQYDLPTEGGATEYIHRVGRTARVGKGGQAWSFVSPSEAEWVKLVEGSMRGKEKAISVGEKQSMSLEGVEVDGVLKSGFGGNGTGHEERATEVQLSFERWALRNKQNAEMARQAFLSHMRAYATHPSNEKHIFHIRHLHLGHLAKSFALRDAPKAAIQKPLPRVTETGHPKTSQGKGRDKHPPDVEQRMQDVVRAQGRFTKRYGVMGSTGASEFQIATANTLEKMVKL